MFQNFAAELLVNTNQQTGVQTVPVNRVIYYHLIGLPIRTILKW